MSLKNDLRKLTEWWMSHIGRRGTTLLLFGALTAWNGYQYVIHYPTEHMSANITAATGLMPLEAWGAIFLLVGVAAILGSFRKRLETIGYSALTGLYSIWSLTFLYAYVSDFFTATQTSYSALVNSAQLGGIAVFIAVCSGWIEIRGDR